MGNGENCEGFGAWEKKKSLSFFAATENDETFPIFSPDGRWIAYCSDQEGQVEVYIRGVSGAGGAIQISHQGGIEPLWGSRGKELFYRLWPGGYRENEFWAVDIQADTSINPGKPTMLFESRGLGPCIPIRNWDISPDGHSFLMVRLEEEEPRPVTELVLIHNWFKEVKRLVPTGK
jgi:hypothetical protein